ncbi:MAG: hypothetical protein LBE02_06735 [Spirochaetaceae bacterium]|jgi:hypothetical protein|nr:hypothetical protein [Spirochaetaceae bacterium]
MNKKLFSLAMPLSLLAVSLLVVSCDNGTSPGGDGANTFTLTNISTAQLNEASQFCYVGLFPYDKTKENVESDVSALLYGSPTSHIIAGRQVIEPYLIAPATINGTLFSASSGFTLEWRGSGTYHIWFGLYDGSTITVYRTNNPITLTAGGSISLNAQTDFTKNGGGTFRIRITNIPSQIMTDGQDGYNLIGLYPANTTTYDIPNALAGRDTAQPADDTVGPDWYEFSMYTVIGGAKYTGPAGNYDIVFINKNTFTVKVLKNVRLEIDQLNTFSYAGFVSP